MKRMLLAACAAGLLGCLAQAASLAWTSDGLPDYRQWGGVGCKVTDAESFTLVVTYQMAEGAAAWDNILGIGKNHATDGELLRVQTAGGNKVGVYGNAGTNTVTAEEFEVDYSAPVRFIVTRDGSEMTVHIGDQYAVSFTLREDLFANMTPADLILGFGASGNNSGTMPDMAAGTYTDIGVYNGVLTDEEIALIADPNVSLASVPEPTALALLLLGLPALALRRPRH